MSPIELSWTAKKEVKGKCALKFQLLRMNSAPTMNSRYLNCFQYFDKFLLTHFQNLLHRMQRKFVGRQLRLDSFAPEFHPYWYHISISYLGWIIWWYQDEPCTGNCFQFVAGSKPRLPRITSPSPSEEYPWSFHRHDCSPWSSPHNHCNPWSSPHDHHCNQSNECHH